jgi:hypothetical protein
VAPILAACHQAVHNPTQRAPAACYFYVPVILLLLLLQGGRPRHPPALPQFLPLRRRHSRRRAMRHMPRPGACCSCCWRLR